MRLAPHPSIQYLPPLTIGAVTYYNVEDLGGYVSFYISTTAVLKSDELVENEGRAVVMDRRSWDSMCEAVEGAA